MTMRYYIEAFDIAGKQILGNLDGQAALTHVKHPTRTAIWRAICDGSLRASKQVRSWVLVDENGRRLASCTRHSDVRHVREFA